MNHLDEQQKTDGVAPPPAPHPGDNAAGPDDSGYAAKDIRILEGLEAVRKRPAMYLSLIHISEPTRPY